MSSLLPASSTASSPADQRLIGGEPVMSCEGKHSQAKMSDSIRWGQFFEPYDHADPAPQAEALSNLWGISLDTCSLLTTLRGAQAPLSGAV